MTLRAGDAPPLRIEYVSKSTLPSTAANTVHVLHMCQAFGALGHEVTLHILGGPGPGLGAWLGAAPTFRLSFMGGADWLPRRRRLHETLWSLGLRLRPRRGAVWYGRHHRLLARLAARGEPVALELHSPPLDGRQRAWTEQVARGRRFLGFVAISEALKAEMLRVMPELAPDRVLVAHDGAPEPERVKTSHAAADPFSVVYAGSFNPGKGAERVVEAARALPELRFHLFGGQPAQVAALRAGAPANAVFHGHVPHAEIMRRLPEFDIALAPYGRQVRGHGVGRSDLAPWMSPLKIFEYMSVGLPLVVSDLPVLREVLAPEETAAFCDPDSLESLVEQVGGLARDEARRRRLGLAARAAFLDAYSWRARARRIAALLAPGAPEERVGLTRR